MEFPFRLKKRSSLSNGIKFALIGLIGMTVIIFSFLSYLQKDVFNKYGEYMDVNSKLGNISVELNDSFSYFSVYMSGRSQRVAQEYQLSNDKLNENLRDIAPKMQADIDSSIFFRTLSNMIENYMRESGKLMSEGTLDAAGYNDLMSLNTQIMYINSQENQLSTSYLKYSSETYSTLLRVYESIALKVYGISIILMLFGAVYAAGVTRNIILVIKKLCSYAEKLSNAHWEIPDIEGQKFTELDKLAVTFNQMKTKIRDSIEKLNLEAELEEQYNREQLKNAENERLLKEIQLTVLQSQMNPHFLFNTLNIISRTAMFENAGGTVGLVEATSKILRYSLNSQSGLVDLAEELEMVRCYIMIQKTRFEEQMEFRLHVDEGMAGVKIPPMTIQPLIENAIVHGLKQKAAGGIVEVTVSRKSGYCRVEIEDNGSGIPEGELKEVLSHGNKCSLGVYNIKKRLELNFGRRELLQIKSEVGRGTLVTVLIPADARTDPPAQEGKFAGISAAQRGAAGG